MKFIAIAAMSLDGKIAASAHHMSDWTSAEDKRMLRAQLDVSDVCIVGRNTYQTAIAPLASRNCIVLTTQVSGVEQVNERCTLLNPRAVSISEFAARNNYRTITVLGGTQTYSFCLENGLIDELWLTIEPVVIGDGLALFAGEFGATMPRFALASVSQLNTQGAVLCKYTSIGGSHV